MTAAMIADRPGDGTPPPPTVTTSAYRRAHGCDPLGFGLWVFRPALRPTAFNHELGGDEIAVTDEYLSAARAAAEIAAARGVIGLVAVLP